MKVVELAGKRFGRLVVRKCVGTNGGRRLWLCKCDCGERTTVPTTSLTSEKTTSCGCRKRETALANCRIWQIKPLHGMTGTPEHKTWMSMIERCSVDYRYANNYADRGVRVCDRWRTFQNFLEDMGIRPSVDHSIDRIDVNGNYEPSNCRWATDKEQQRNRRNTRYLLVDNVRRPLMDVADELGIKKNAAQYFFSTFKKLKARFGEISIS